MSYVSKTSLGTSALLKSTQQNIFQEEPATSASELMRPLNHTMPEEAQTSSIISQSQTSASDKIPISCYNLCKYTEIQTVWMNVFAVADKLQETIRRVAELVTFLKENGFPCHKPESHYIIEQDITDRCFVYVSGTAYSIEPPAITEQASSEGFHGNTSKDLMVDEKESVSNGASCQLCKITPSQTSIAPPVKTRWRTSRKLKRPLISPSLETTQSELEILMQHLKNKLKELGEAQAYYDSKGTLWNRWKADIDRDHEEGLNSPAKKLLESMMSKKALPAFPDQRNTDPIVPSTTDASDVDGIEVEDEHATQVNSTSTDQDGNISEAVCGKTIKAPKTTVFAGEPDEPVVNTTNGRIDKRETSGIEGKAGKNRIPKRGSALSDIHEEDADVAELGDSGKDTKVERASEGHHGISKSMTEVLSVT